MIEKTSYFNTSENNETKDNVVSESKSTLNQEEQVKASNKPRKKPVLNTTIHTGKPRESYYNTLYEYSDFKDIVSVNAQYNKFCIIYISKRQNIGVIAHSVDARICYLVNLYTDTIFNLQLNIDEVNFFLSHAESDLDNHQQIQPELLDFYYSIKGLPRIPINYDDKTKSLSVATSKTMFSKETYYLVYKHTNLLGLAVDDKCKEFLQGRFYRKDLQTIVNKENLEYTLLGENIEYFVEKGVEVEHLDEEQGEEY